MGELTKRPYIIIIQFTLSENAWIKKEPHFVKIVRNGLPKLSVRLSGLLQQEQHNWSLYGVYVSNEKHSTSLALTLPSWRRLNTTQHVVTQTSTQRNQPLQMAVAKPQTWLNFFSSDFAFILSPSPPQVSFLCFLHLARIFRVSWFLLTNLGLATKTFSCFFLIHA